MKIFEIEADLIALILQCRALGVPPSDVDEALALTRAGEPGVALENLCTQLFEYDAVVPAATLEAVERLGRAMGIDESYWKRLAVS